MSCRPPLRRTTRLVGAPLGPPGRLCERSNMQSQPLFGDCSKSVAEWSVDDCAQFLSDCASKLTPQLNPEKLKEYIESFRKNDITGLNLSDEDDSA